MGKRLIAFITSVTLLFCLAACGIGTPEWEPVRASEDVEPYARRAIEIIDEYLAFEITADEAEKAFRELHVRIIPLNISDDDSEYNKADRIIDDCIDTLAMLSIKNRSDAELNEYKDIFAFQIGEKVSKKTYTAPQHVFSEKEEELSQYIDIEKIHFDLASIHQSADSCFIYFVFDTRNGFTEQDITQILESAFSNTEKTISKSFSFTVYIQCYDQPAVCISIYTFSDSFVGTVEESGTQITEGNEATYLYEFDSLEGLPEAISIACDFVGL